MRDTIKKTDVVARVEYTFVGNLKRLIVKAGDVAEKNIWITEQTVFTYAMNKIPASARDINIQYCGGLIESDEFEHDGELRYV